MDETKENIKVDSSTGSLQTFICERCGFRFQKETDYPPHLCYRCMRFIAKNVFKIMNQIQPPVSRPETSDGL